MKNLFLFTGEEAYLLHDQINLWKDSFRKKHGDINLESLEADSVPLNDIMAAVNAVPFLGDKRLIFIHDLPDKPKTRNKDKVSKADEKREDQLKKLSEDFDNIPESSVVVFVQSAPDKRRSFYKSLVKKAEVKEFSPLGGAVLNQWIQNRVQIKGAKIGISAAEYLASLTGHKLWRLSMEIDKLCSHSPGENLSNDLIDKLVVPTMEANIFHLTDALGTKNHRKAIQNLHRSMAAGENLRPVFYMIVRQFRLLLQGSAFSAGIANPSATAFSAKLKLHPFAARNTLSQVKNFKFNELKKAYGSLLEIDIGLKTSRIRVVTDNQDELALAIERFILDFCR